MRSLRPAPTFPGRFSHKLFPDPVTMRKSRQGRLKNVSHHLECARSACEMWLGFVSFADAVAALGVPDGVDSSSAEFKRQLSAPPTLSPRARLHVLVEGAVCAGDALLVRHSCV